MEAMAMDSEAGMSGGLAFCPFCGVRIPIAGQPFCTGCGRSLATLHDGQSRDGDELDAGDPGVRAVRPVARDETAVKPRDEASAHRAGESAPASSGRRTKRCPMCAEDVWADARLCRFCRFEFRPDEGTGADSRGRSDDASSAPPIATESTASRVAAAGNGESDLGSWRVGSAYYYEFAIRDTVTVHIDPRGLILVSAAASRRIPWATVTARDTGNGTMLIADGSMRLVRLEPLDGQAVDRSVAAIEAAQASPPAKRRSTPAATQTSGAAGPDPHEARCSVSGCVAHLRLEPCAVDRRLVCLGHRTPAPVGGGYLCPTCASSARLPSRAGRSPASSGEGRAPRADGHASASTADVLALVAGIAMVVSLFLPWVQSRGFGALALTAIQFVGQDVRVSAVVIAAFAGAAASAFLVLNPESGAGTWMRVVYAVACVAMLGIVGLVLLAFNSAPDPTSAMLISAFVSPGSACGSAAVVRASVC